MVEFHLSRRLSEFLSRVWEGNVEMIGGRKSVGARRSMTHGLTKSYVARFIALSASSRSTAHIFPTAAFHRFPLSCRQYSSVSLQKKAQSSITTMAHNLPNLVKPTHYDIKLYNFDLEKFTFSGDVSIRYNL